MRSRFAARLVQLIVAVGTVLGASVSQALAQDRQLSADFPVVYRAGGLNAPEWAFFEKSSRASFDAAGNLYVMDAAAGRVVVLDSLGRLARIIGRRGEGPGEFDRATDLVVWRDGRLAVADLGQAAYKVFGLDGALERFVRMEVGEGIVATFTGVRTAIRPDPLGDAIIAQGAPSTTKRMAGLLSQILEGERQDEAGVDDRGLERLDLDGNVVSGKTVLRAWAVPQEEVTRDLSPEDLMDVSVVAGMTGEKVFFAPGFHWDVLPNGTIAYSDSSAYVIKLATPGGSVVDVIRRPLSPEEVTPRIREEAVARALREFEERSNDPQVAAMSGFAAAMLPGMIESMREAVANREFFVEIPVVRGLRTTWDGGLWIQRRGEEPWDDDGPIDVFNPDHEYVGTLAGSLSGMPAAFGSDGLVLYWETDDLGVPTIVVKRLPEELR